MDCNCTVHSSVRLTEYVGIVSCLQVVFGEVLPVQSHLDVDNMALFISNRFLYNLSIAESYAHPTVPDMMAKGVWCVCVCVCM